MRMKCFETVEKSYRTTFMIVLAAMAIAVILLLTGCTTTKYVPVIEHQTDTLIQRVVERDSIHVHDSIRVTEKGDTIRIERWHTKFVEREVHDTTYVSKIDSVPAPYPVTEYVERKRSTMEWGLIIIGIVALLGGIVWIASRLKKYLP